MSHANLLYMCMILSGLLFLRCAVLSSAVLCCAVLCRVLSWKTACCSSMNVVERCISRTKKAGKQESS